MTRKQQQPQQKLPMLMRQEQLQQQKQQQQQQEQLKQQQQQQQLLQQQQQHQQQQQLQQQLEKQQQLQKQRQQQEKQQQQQQAQQEPMMVHQQQQQQHQQPSQQQQPSPKRPEVRPTPSQRSRSRSPQPPEIQGVGPPVMKVTETAIAPTQGNNRVPALQQSAPEALFEPVDNYSYNTSMYNTAPKAPLPHMVGDKRLYVKVIKASGLSIKDLNIASLVCMLSTDEPVQGYATSTVRRTQHPFWDEHFLFDITHDTQELRVEVYDKTQPQGDDFIGEAIVYVDDLRKTPSSRQILRLHPSSEHFEYNCGTVTAEFLFMDPAEADLLLDSMTTTANTQLSPRRRIEVARSVAPGGTLVTTTTTTTERPQYGRHDPGLDGSPNYIEKSVYTEDSPHLYHTSPSTVSSETIPSNGVPSDLPASDLHVTSPANGAHHDPHTTSSRVSDPVAAAAIRELEDRSRRPREDPRGRRQRSQPKTGSVVITGVRRTIENWPAEEEDEGSYPQQEGPVPSYAMKDDLELVRRSKVSKDPPGLKKSRTLGGSLKKLFRRSRSRRAESRSREGSTSRSKGNSRDNSLTRRDGREGSVTREGGRANSVS